MTDLSAEERARVAGKVFDKTGRQIMVGDVLKVFHFTGARWRKHYFMYKQVVGHIPPREGGCGFLVISHLNMKAPDERDGGYWIAQDGKVLLDTEIVQGIDWHHDRPREEAIRQLHIGEGAGGQR